MPTPKINLSAIVKNKAADNKELDKNEVSETNTEASISMENNVDTTSIEDLKINDKQLEESTKEKNENTKVEPNAEEIADKKRDNIVVETTKVENSAIPRLSLNSIKTVKSINEINEEKKEEQIENHIEMKDELLEVLYTENDWTDIANSNISETNSITTTTENKVENKVENENSNQSNQDTETNIKEIEEIEKKINEKVEEEIKEKKSKKPDTKEPEEVIDEKTELFWNYKSEFIEKENKIINNVEVQQKRFRDKLREPKTRLILVFWLIFITIWFIGTLFLMFPENHSFEIYKKWIVTNVNNIKKNYIDGPWVKETISIEWFAFDTFKQDKLFGWSNYKYNEIEYESKDKMLEVVNKDLTLLKQEAERKRIEEEARKRAEAEKLAQEEAERLRLESERKKSELDKKVKDVVKEILTEKYKDLYSKYIQQ